MNTYALHSPQPDGRPARLPTDRQAAVYTINASLLALDLQRWSWTVMAWLALYDGFEQYVPPADDPAIAVSRIFAHLARMPPGSRVGPAQVLHDIEKQHFMFWHAQWVDGEGTPVGLPWRPLEREPAQSFWTYLGNRPDGAKEVRSQRLPMMHCESSRFRNWLMAGWLRFSMPTAPRP